MPKFQPPPQTLPGTPQPQEPCPTNVHIVRSADVVLSVKSNTKLFVSSKVLSASSPVFEAMFKPEWFDGKKSKKAGDELPEIDFSEHDADEMTTLCNLLHFQNKAVTKPVTWEKLTHLAILADQYCCADAINFALTVWTKELDIADKDGKDGKDGKGTDPTGRVLVSEFCHTAVSYLLRDEKEFKSATSKLIINHAGTYRDFGEYLGFEVLPWVFPVILEEQRTRVRCKLFAQLRRYIYPLFQCHQASVNTTGSHYPSQHQKPGQGPHMTLMQLLAEWEEHPISLAEMKSQLGEKDKFPLVLYGIPLKGDTAIVLRIAGDIQKIAEESIGVSSGLLVSEVRAAAGLGDAHTGTEDEKLNAALEKTSLS